MLTTNALSTIWMTHSPVEFGTELASPCRDQKPEPCCGVPFYPAKLQFGRDFPFELLGEEFPLAGAYIKKAVLRAAFYARRDQSEIGLKHLVSAARSESEELGTLVYDRISGPLEDALAEEQEEVGLP